MDQERAQLIELVQQYPHLWDKKDPLYRDKIAVENAWSTISEVMEVAVEDCREVWNSIRTRFIRERNQYRNLPSGSGSYTSKWPYYCLCTFLERAIVTRKTKSNVLKSGTEGPTKDLWSDHIILDDGTLSQEMVPQDGTQEETLSEEVSLSQIVFGEDIENLNPQVVENAVSEDRPSCSKNLDPPRRTMLQGVRKQKKENEAIYENVMKDTFTKINRFLEKPEEKLSESDDYYFGVSIGKYLEKVKNKKRKLILKAQILNMFAESEDTDSE